MKLFKKKQEESKKEEYEDKYNDFCDGEYHEFIIMVTYEVFKELINFMNDDQAEMLFISDLWITDIKFIERQNDFFVMNKLSSFRVKITCKVTNKIEKRKLK